MIKWLLILLLFICPYSWAVIELDNSDAQYINVGAQAEFDVSEFSICCWFNPIFLASEGVTTLIGNDSAATGWALNYNQDGTGAGNARDVAGWVNDGAWKNTGAATDALTDDVWTHICYTLTGGTASIYTDGVLRNSTGSIGTPLYLANVFDIGKGLPYGRLKEVAYWDIGLTANQVHLLAVSKVRGLPLQVAKSDLLGYWPLDDGPNLESSDTDVVRDFSTYKNNGAGVGGLWKSEGALSYP